MTQYTPKAAVPYAELTDAPNMQTYAQGLATALDGMVIPKYADTSARDSANPTPTGGDVAYVGSNNDLYMFYADTSSWDIVGGRVIKSTSAISIASGWSLSSSVCRKSLHTKLCYVQVNFNRTGATLTSTNNNLPDTLAFTITDSTFRPTEASQGLFCDGGTVNVLITANADGTCVVRTGTFDLQTGDNVIGNFMYLTD